jgi:hypothetical protein
MITLNTKKKIRWKKIGHPDPRGHRFFTTPEEVDSIFLADFSGEFPDTCQDKLLHLDTNRSINITYDDSFNVPVLDKNLKETWTPASFVETAWLCLNHGFCIEVGEQSLTIALS